MMKINMEVYLNHDINDQAPPKGIGFKKEKSINQ